MALFEDNSQQMETIKSGCPICHSDVKGNDIYDYLCKKCNILFKSAHLRLSRERVEQLVKEKVIKKYSETKDSIKILDKIPTKNITHYYIVSKQSNILHISNCPFAKNIKKENLVKYLNMESAKYGKKCRCVE